MNRRNTLSVHVQLGASEIMKSIIAGCGKNYGILWSDFRVSDPICEECGDEDGTTEHNLTLPVFRPNLSQT